MFQFKSYRYSLLSSYLVITLVWVVSYGIVTRLEHAWAVLGCLIGTVLITVSLAVLFAGRLSGNLAEIAEAAQEIANGDLTRRVPVASGNEFGLLAESFNRMVDDLGRVVHQIKHSAESVSATSQDLWELTREMNTANSSLTTQMNDIAAGSEQQSRLIEGTLQVIHRVNSSAEEINHIAEQTSTVSVEVGQAAEAGSAVASQALGAMDQSYHNTREAVTKVRGFHLGLKRIDDLVGKVRVIAGQTHILAINASIEAKKAGDAGIGFSVIANEVRRLSDEVRSFSAEITGLATEILSNAEEIILIMNRGNEAVGEARQYVERAGEAHKSVVNRVLSVFNRFHDIHALTQKQTKGTDQLVTTQEEFARVARTNADRTGQAANSIQDQAVTAGHLLAKTEHLSDLATELEGLVQAFIIEGDRGN